MGQSYSGQGGRLFLLAYAVLAAAVYLICGEVDV
jgi:hypothetical protein